MDIKHTQELEDSIWHELLDTHQEANQERVSPRNRK